MFKTIQTISAGKYALPLHLVPGKHLLLHNVIVNMFAWYSKRLPDIVCIVLMLPTSTLNTETFIHYH